MDPWKPEGKDLSPAWPPPLALPPSLLQLSERGEGAGDIKQEKDRNSTKGTDKD